MQWTRGKDERNIETIAATSLRHRDWYDWIPLALFAYRRTKHPVTGYSSFYGREPTVPLDSILIEIHARFDFAFARSFQINRRADDKKKEEQKEQYNRRREEEEFSVGDWILVERIVKPGEDKFKQPFEGPFRIRRKLSALNYRLEDIHGNKIEKTFNIVQMKVNFQRHFELAANEKDDSDDTEDPRSTTFNRSTKIFQANWICTNLRRRKRSK